ncbi:sensor histidine kinase, partial [Jiangella rhizosphaerae]
MPDRSWRLVFAGAVVVAAGVLGAARPWTVPLGCASVVAVVVMFWWPASHVWLPWGAAGAGAVSLAATVAHLAGPWPGSPPWGMVELAVLSVLVGACARWAPVRAAVPAAVVAGLGGATSLLRATDGGTPDELSALEAVYAVSFWALAPIAAAGAGLLLRHQHDRRVRAVAAARRAQRLELARDLHDYVAHDVSEMIAQAQAAGTVVPAGTPAGDALRRIEAAGLRAMASMDRTVRILHSDDDAGGGAAGAAVGSGTVRPQPGLADLPAVVERFAASGPARVVLDADDDLAASVPREVGGTAHRVVVEALTNVRRHASGAAVVEVRVRRCDDGLEVSVADDGAAQGAGPGPGRSGGPDRAGGLGRTGGLGLSGLAERVGALGGTLRA